MNEEQFKILNDKLDLISKALLWNLVKNLEFKEQVTHLSNIGLKEIEITKILSSNRAKIHSILWRKKDKQNV